jgi:hypothetical protein
MFLLKNIFVAFYAALVASSPISPYGTQEDPTSVLIPRQEDSDVNIFTTLFGFTGCSSKDQTEVREAWEDAIEIAAAVAPTVDDVDKLDPLMYDNRQWWGKFDSNDENEQLAWQNITSKRAFDFSDAVVD